MSTYKDNPEYTFVTDTNLYAGNFLQEMGAYITGWYDDYHNPGQGTEEALEWVEVRNTEHEDSAYDLFVNPDWFNNGLGGEFRLDDPDAEEKALEAHKNHKIAYAQKYIKLTKDNYDLPSEQRNRLGWTDEAIEKTIARHEQEIEEAKAETEVKHYPAYLSVAIFLTEKPTQEQLDVLKKRAHSFVAKSDYAQKKKLAIEGFRLVKKVANYEETEV